MKYVKILSISLLLLSSHVENVAGMSDEDKPKGCGCRRAIDRVLSLIGCSKKVSASDRLPKVAFVSSLPQALMPPPTLSSGRPRPVLAIHTNNEGLEAVRRSGVFTSTMLAQLHAQEVDALRGASSDRLYQGAQNLSGFLRLGASIPVEEIFGIYKRAADGGNRDAREMVAMIECLPLWETHPLTGLPVLSKSLGSLTSTEKSALQRGYGLLRANTEAGHASSRAIFQKMDWERIRRETGISL